MKSPRPAPRAVAGFAALLMLPVLALAADPEFEARTELPRLLIIVRGAADVMLTDPAGRVNYLHGAELVNGIPDCERVDRWKDPDDTTKVATAFQLNQARTGLYAVRVRARSAGRIRVEATATPKAGVPCSSSDSASFKVSEKIAFSIEFTPRTGESDTGCVIRAGHRLGPPVPKKKES